MLMKLFLFKKNINNQNQIKKSERPELINIMETVSG